jgi:hypothetical protein
MPDTAMRSAIAAPNLEKTQVLNYNPDTKGPAQVLSCDRGQHGIGQEYFRKWHNIPPAA